MSDQTEKYILSFDLSTSGAKAALVSVTGKILATEFEPDTLNLLPDGGVEQDPALWWQRIKDTSRRLIARRLIPVNDIKAISCTGQWSGTVALDRNGNHLANAMIWLDCRGAPYVKKITDGWLKIQGYGLAKLIKWARLTGGIPTHAGKDAIANILYIKNVKPELYQNTYKFLEPKDFINYKFTGKFAASYDSITLHWVTDNRRIANVVYDRDLIRMSTIDPAKLPELKRSVDILGLIRPEVADEIGLSRQVRVVAGSPDVQSAAIGAGAVKDYKANMYIGTSSWLTCHVPFKKLDLRHNIASLPSAIPDKYLATNEQESAGACLNYLRDNIFCQDSQSRYNEHPDAMAEFNQLAREVPPGSHKLIFTPWLHGERTPVADSSLRACFFNQSLQTTKADMIRAVFEGVAYNSRWLLECMDRFIKRPIDNINVIGGGANSVLWCQIFADVMNRTIHQVKDPIWANLRGAAFIAAVGMEWMSFDEVPKRIHIAATYTPKSANRDIYNKLYKAFRKIHTRNKSIYADLNQE
jgi:xylulokinase|tara:strand:+ start:1931 stop:3511 length:1581 start_codon:yes stop_codon:yes gene_type:complete